MIHTIEETITRLRQIQLDSEHSPEQILHMILAGGTSQSIYNIQQGIHQSALEFLCRETGNIRNYPILGGIIHRDQNGPYFIRGTPHFPVDQHSNQFLGTLAVAGVNFKGTRILTDRGVQGTLADMADRAMKIYRPEISVDLQSEPGWSLMLFSIYAGVEAEWKNNQNQTCTVEDILESACRWPYGAGSCLGTQVVEGIAVAVSRYCLEKDLEPEQLNGVWKRAWNWLQDAIRLLRKNQREDGTIQRCWYKEKPYPRNFREFSEVSRDIVAKRLTPGKAIVYPTGHCLDALSSLSLFLAEDREWIQSASYILAQTVETHWLEVYRDISQLTHAVHALKTFLD
jgi:hypothetical protein